MPLKKGLYALYLRKSRADVEKESWGECETLARHEQTLVALAKREGYVLDEPYYKELVSGERISERYEFQRLMAKVSEGVYDGILVHEISRLGRGEPMEYGWILYTLKQTHTVIVTPTKVYDPCNQDDARALQMELFISNMELGSIRTRLISGCRASAKNGCYIKPTPPFGYDRIKIDGNWTLAPNTDSSIVQMIFERSANGEPLGSIAKTMNDSGMRLPNGGFWSAARLSTIIANPHYKGLIRYGYYQRQYVQNGFQVAVKNTTNEDCILVDGLHDALVTDEVWELANKRNYGSAPVKRSAHLKNPLAGLLVCAKCGKPMLRFLNKSKSTGRKLEHYRHAPFCDCKMRGASMHLVIDLLIEALEELADGLENQVVVGQVSPSKTELDSIEKKLAQEELRLNKLMELFFADAISVDEFKERRAKSEIVEKQLKQRHKELLKKKPTPKETAVTLREAICLLSDDSVEASAKNALLKSAIERIEYNNLTVTRKNIDIHLRVILKK